MELFVICILLSLTEGLTRINNEFNSNIFEDEIEYGLDNSDEIFDDGLEHFFRQVRSLEEDYKNVETIDTEEYYRKIPKRLIDDHRDPSRFKRSTQNDELQQLVDDGEKPLEIIVLDLSNGTENGVDSKETNRQLHSENHEDSLKINDFIRFKRDIRDDNATKIEDDDKSRLKRERDENDGKRDVGFKEQWMKQPFPITRNVDQHQLDDNLRTPRVNFITQRRSESAPPPVYYNHEPNYRYRDNSDDYYTRFPRHYQPYQDPYNRNYYRDENPRYQPGSPYETDDNIGNYYNERPVYKQRRIIYYATLPEVVRSPHPVGDLGDRYNYRDSYEADGRYARIPSQNAHRVGVDPYRFRKPFPVEKSRYDESGSVKGAYPLKVSTDVNVKEIKKNPERRIFSEGDHRYNQGTYQPLDRY